MSATYSEEMQRLLDAARRHGFATPCCGSCGCRFYPPQAWCPRCLAPDVHYTADSGLGVVVSTAVVHRSLDSSWEGRLPLPVVTARTDSGVSVFALSGSELSAGTRVRVQLEDDMFHAIPLAAGRNDASH
jgi:uncharacterized OB-fold protein